MSNFEVTINAQDIEVLTLTNVGVYGQEVRSDGKIITLSTADKSVSDLWIAQLKAAQRDVFATKRA